jgi:hypothetical protein
MAQKLGPALSVNGAPDFQVITRFYQALNLFLPLALLLLIIALPAFVFMR